MHGDTLCTEDVAYLKMREQIRHPVWQQQFLQQPLASRRMMAEQLRQQSKEATANKQEYIMDVTQAAVDAVLLAHDSHCLIHGHTHRLAQHDFMLQQQAAQRWVLGDWYDSGSVLICRPDGKEFKTLTTD